MADEPLLGRSRRLPTDSLPAHLASARGRWAALILTTAACAIASGPVASWPTLEPMLLDAGVWESAGDAAAHANLDAVYGASVAVQLGSSLPAGWIFDRYGGRVAALGGALLAATGLLLMGAATCFPASWSWLLWLGYPTAMLGGQINSYGLFSFLWLLPDDQNLISSMVGGATALSDMLALVAVGLNACCGLFVGHFFVLLALLSVCSGAFSFAVCPTHAVCLKLASSVLAEAGTPAHGEREDAADDAQGSGNGDDRWCGKEIDSVRSSWVLMKRHSGANSLLIVFSILYVMAMIYPNEQMFYYYKGLFASKDTAVELVNVYAFMYGAAGFVCSLGGGKLCDYLGLEKFTQAAVWSVVVFAVIIPVRSVPVQVLAQVVMVVGMQLYMIIVNRFAMLYAPPELFGTFGGVQFCFVSVGTLVGMMGVSAVLDGIASASAIKYQIPYVALSIGSATVGFVLVHFWRQHPPPRVGGLSADD